MIMYDGNGPGSVLQQPIVHNMQKKHFISMATVKWQTKLVLLWIVNLAASTVLPSAVYITMHMTGYNTVQIDLILMQTDVLFVFQWKRSKLNYIATEKKAEERMIVVFISPSGISWAFFRFLWPKRTDFAAAYLKMCGDICGISYCFAVKIYHGQHSSNIVITFLTSRTIVGLQTNIWGHQCH